MPSCKITVNSFLINAHVTALRKHRVKELLPEFGWGMCVRNEKLLIIKLQVGVDDFFTKACNNNNNNTRDASKRPENTSGQFISSHQRAWLKQVRVFFKLRPLHVVYASWDELEPRTKCHVSGYRARPQYAFQ